MGILCDLLEYCEANDDDDLNLEDWLSQYPQYNYRDQEEKCEDKPKSINLDSDD